MIVLRAHDTMYVSAVDVTALWVSSFVSLLGTRLDALLATLSAS